MRPFLPKTLFGRSILIVVLPMILLQVLVTVVFYERHWESVARRLAAGVAGEIAAVVSLRDRFPGEEAEKSILTAARSQMKLAISFVEGELLDITQTRDQKFSYMEKYMARSIRANFPARAFSMKTNDKLKSVIIQVQLPGEVMQIIVRDKRLFSNTTYIFVLWMVGISLILLAIAVIFLRNQMRPIRQLSIAAEKFGKGQDVPEFSPRGASEIKLAARAFIEMKNRIKRQITQRTEMLAGVSHDLRTPLTRMKLQLAMMGEQEDSNNLLSDVNDMEQMIEGYLSFARGQEEEAVENTDIEQLLHDVIANARRQGASIEAKIPGDITLSVRPNGLKRCLTNIIENARRYADHMNITVFDSDSNLHIVVDDDGPGIPEQFRREVFLPFHRLDPSRNRETGGSGLGLSIARDVIHGHGGDIELGDSPMSGLRVSIRLPR